MGDFTSEKEQKLLESEAEVSNTEDTNADELTFEETSGFSDDDDDSEEEEKKPKRNSLDMTSKIRSSLSVSLR